MYGVHSLPYGKERNERRAPSVLRMSGAPEGATGCRRPRPDFNVIGLVSEKKFLRVRPMADIKSVFCLSQVCFIHCVQSLFLGNQTVFSNLGIWSIVSTAYRVERIVAATKQRTDVIRSAFPVCIHFSSSHTAPIR